MIAAFGGAPPFRAGPKDAGEPSPAFRPGDWVAVRSAEEIAATLDANGELDGLPFMPEMAPFCGRRLRVKRRVDRTCVEGVGLRRLDGCVILEDAACDGAAHDGCERGCMIFWKEAWLAPSGEPAPRAASRAELRPAPARRGKRYLCQSTELAKATREFGGGWRLLLRDLNTGELGLGGFAAIASIGVINRLRSRLGLPEIGIIRGRIGPDAHCGLHLGPGDWVKVKGRRAIRSALDGRGHNRGLRFEPEMALHLGTRRQVERRIQHMIDEQTGRMLELNDTVVLRGVECKGLCMKNCPRSAAMFWREAWLERTPG